MHACIERRLCAEKELAYTNYITFHMSADTNCLIMALLAISTCRGAMSSLDCPNGLNFSMVHLCAVHYRQVIWVPGSFELPVTSASMARSGQYSAVLAIGAVVRFLAVL